MRPASLPSEAYLVGGSQSVSHARNASADSALSMRSSLAGPRRSIAHTRNASADSAISTRSALAKDTPPSTTAAPAAEKLAAARSRLSRFSHLPPIPTRKASTAPSEGTSVVDASRASVSEATPALPYKAPRRTVLGSASPFS